MENWIKTSEKQPDKKENVRVSQVPCLAFYKNEIRVLYFNHTHECWDNEDGDDFECRIEDVEYWMLLPEKPNTNN